MANQNALYSDLNKAIVLATKLASKRGRKRQRVESPQETSYVSFQWDGEPQKSAFSKPNSAPAAANLNFKEPKPPVKKASEEESALKMPSGSTPFDSWDDFLSWSVKGTSVEAGFVVNTQGFVIAQWGQIPGEGLDGLGAELCFSVEQLKRVGVKSGRLSWLEVEYNKEHVVALIDETLDSGEFIVAYYGHPSGSTFPKQALLRAIALSKEHLM